MIAHVLYYFTIRYYLLPDSKINYIIITSYFPIEVYATASMVDQTYIHTYVISFSKYLKYKK